jgi:hypothetical protein
MSLLILRQHAEVTRELLTYLYGRTFARHQCRLVIISASSLHLYFIGLGIAGRKYGESSVRLRVCKRFNLLLITNPTRHSSKGDTQNDPHTPQILCFVQL